MLINISFFAQSYIALPIKSMLYKTQFSYNLIALLKIPKYKTIHPRIYRDKNGFISSILFKRNISASFRFHKRNILEQSDKQIKTNFATVVLQNPEEKTDIVTFKLEDVEYNRLGKNLTKVTAKKGTIESHIHEVREEMKNSTLVFELKH
ncbi:10311_t:CDS:1 [Gigaspora margarita]|uniref:10311_t:CDS:1 n=1 Tax=Gigaspora margarita TaxID=4874 RepID=A0ABN7V3N5_GIGMA|nr:10311_t:CDS:1 [Gigaspora margarita]